MMFNSNQTYINQLQNIKIDRERFKNKVFFITGASGLIGTFLVDALMKADINVKIYAVGRSEEKARKRFSDYWNSADFSFVKQDVNLPIDADIECDYIIHGASNTHPIAYSSDPIGTINANVVGTRNILEFAATRSNNPRVMFMSSVEVYGENRGDAEKFDENYCGYIDCNTVRAGYPESKRLGEAMCQAYIKAKNIDIVIPRFSRTYGPTMSDGDSKAIAQFIKKALGKEDIVLKSKGEQLYSYTYVADAAAAVLHILLYGKIGEAYNVSDENSEIMLKDLAKILADIAGTKVVFELPDKVESAGYSTATKAVLDSAKLRQIGWESRYDIKTGLEETVRILEECK